MSRMKCAFVLASMLLVPVLTLAQDEGPKWSYVEGGWIDFDPDDGISDDGWFAGGSFGLGKHFHLLAEYDDVGNYTFWNAGVGWHGLLGDKADLFAQVLWANIQIDDGNIDEDGYDVQGGVRWRMVKWFELNGQVNWVDYGGDAGDDTTGEVGILFYLGRVGIGANWETGDANTTQAFFRWNFGK